MDTDGVYDGRSSGPESRDESPQVRLPLWLSLLLFFVVGIIVILPVIISAYVYSFIDPD